MTRSSKMNSPAAGVSMTERLFAVVPAAGGGSRIGAAVPKQYLDLGGEPMLHRSVEALLAEPRIATIVVVLAPDDTRRPPAGRFDARVHWLPEGVPPALRAFAPASMPLLPAIRTGCWCTTQRAPGCRRRRWRG